MPRITRADLGASSCPLPPSTRFRLWLMCDSPLWARNRTASMDTARTRRCTRVRHCRRQRGRPKASGSAVQRRLTYLLLKMRVCARCSIAQHGPEGSANIFPYKSCNRMIVLAEDNYGSCAVSKTWYYKSLPKSIRRRPAPIIVNFDCGCGSWSWDPE